MKHRRLFASVSIAGLLCLASCGFGGTADPATSPAVACAPGATLIGPTTAELEAALAAAAPGDVLQLSDTTYPGRFVIEAAGTADASITLCGSRDAVLDGGGTEAGYVLHLDGAQHWLIDGFAVTNGSKGVVLDAASHNELRGLSVSHTGDEGIHLRAGSSDNVVRDSTVSETGRVQAEYGEGIYVGSAASNWCRYSGCDPDASDRNELVGNTVSAVTAEAIDVKEGTTGGLIRDNTLSIAPAAVVDSVIDMKGDRWQVEANAIEVATGFGIQVQSVTGAWGTGNTVRGNTFSLAADAGAVTLAESARGLGNVVTCDNLADGAPAPVTPACRAG